MAIRVTCTQCGAAYKIDETKIPATGGAVKCQTCGTRFAVMPHGNATPPPAAAPTPSPPPSEQHSAVTTVGKAPEASIPLPAAPKVPQSIHDEVTQPGRSFPTIHDEETKPTQIAPNAIPLPAAPPAPAAASIPLPAAKPAVASAIPLPAAASEKTNPAIPLPAAPAPSGAIEIDENDDLFADHDKTMVSTAPPAVLAPPPPVIAPPEPPPAPVIAPPPPPPVILAPPPPVIALPEPEPLPDPADINDGSEPLSLSEPEEAEAIEEVDEIIDEATAVGPPPGKTTIDFDELPAADEGSVQIASGSPPDDLPAPLDASETPQFSGITLGAAVQDTPSPLPPVVSSDAETFVGPPPTAEPATEGAESLDIPEALDTSELMGTPKVHQQSDDDLPTPLELEGGEPTQKNPTQHVDSPAEDRQRKLEEADDADRNEQRSKRRMRIGVMAAAVFTLVVGGGTLTSYLVTGEMPWTLLDPPPPPPPKPIVQLPPVPPIPDFAAIEGKDLDAYQKALAVLDDRVKARKARSEPLENKDDTALRAKLLWQGAILLGSHVLADQLVAMTPSETPDPHPSEARANAARAFLKGDTAAMQAQLDKLFALDKGDHDSHLLAGYVALIKNDSDAASKHFEEVTKVDEVNKTGPKGIDAYLGQAEIARRAGDRDSAASFVEKAEEAQPQTMRVILARAELNNEGDTAARAEAKKSATEVMKFVDNLGERDKARARALYATFAAESALSNIALHELQKAWDEDPSMPLGRNLLWSLVAKGDVEAAQKVLDRAKKLDDETYKESFFLADVQLNLKRNALAEVATAIAAAKTAGVAKRSVLFAEGELFEAQKKNPAALKAYGAAAKADKTFAPPMLAAIRLAPQKPKVKISRLALVAKLTSDARAFAAQADLLLETGAFAEAADKYLQALQNDPWVVDQNRVSQHYAEALTKSGKAAEGARVAIENTVVDPKNIESLLTVIQSARASGAFDEATRLINLGLDNFPKEPRLRLAEADILIAKDSGDKARAVLQQLIKANDKMVGAHELMARSYFPKEPDLVKLHIKKAIELKADEPRFHFLLGQAYVEKGKFEEARDAFERTLELNDKDVEAHIMLAKVTDQLGRKKESAEELKKALALDPDRKALVGDLGQKLEDLNQPAEALELYEKAFKREPTNGGLAVRIGRIHQQNGNKANAIKFFRLALKLNPNDASAHYRLGFLFKDDGKTKDALKEFQTYLKLSPSAQDRKEIEDEIADLQQ